MKPHSIITARQEHIPTDLHSSSRIYINNQTNETRKPQRILFRAFASNEIVGAYGKDGQRRWTQMILMRKREGQEPTWKTYA